MPRRQRSNNSKTNSHRTKSMNKHSSVLNINHISPLTESQNRAFLYYYDNKNLVLSGMAGTGKTFIAMYLALKQALDTNTTTNSVYIVRSAVPTRDLGFLPGTATDKLSMYEPAYRAICSDLFGRNDAYEILQSKGVLKFISTSYLRGQTYDNSIIILDEMQNCTYQELDTVMTRIGQNSRVIFSGDFKQADLTSSRDRQGLSDFLKVLRRMPKETFGHVSFGLDDIVRSGLVREYLIAKDEYFTWQWYLGIV